MFRGIFLFIFLISFNSWSSTEELISKAESTKLYQHPKWLKLLHYEKNLLSGYSSEADGKGYFLHPKGMDDPKLELFELIKTITLPQQKKSLDKHPACLFPARKIFLMENLGWKRKRKFKCPKFEKYKRGISAKSVSLVFSSYYIDTPASAFGHTLLKFSKYKNFDSKRPNTELLDTAVNYAASVTTDNAFLYGFLGMVGGFRGEFAKMPYFYKIREYNDHESRDLWSYHLNLTQKQINFLVSHIWEMSTTWFSYFYFTENCSYHMLSVLDAVNPKWNLTKKIPYIVIPVDTLKAIQKTPGLIKKISFLPSKRRVLKKRLANLNIKEKNILKSVLKNFNPKKIPKNISNKTKAKILDTAMDFLDFKFSGPILKEEKKAIKRKRKFLIARSKTGIQGNPLIIERPDHEIPHLGHNSRRISFNTGYGSQTGFFNSLEYRFALHDLMDMDRGHNPNSTMEMGKFELRYNYKVDYRNNSSFLRPENITLINVKSLNPLEQFLSNWSWKAYFGAKQIRDDVCTDCFTPTAEVGAGVSRKFDSFSYSLLFTTKTQFHKKLGHRGFRLGIGPEMALKWSPTDYFKVKLFGDVFYYVFINNHQSYKYGLESRVQLIDDLGLSIKYSRYENENESHLGLLYYY